MPLSYRSPLLPRLSVAFILAVAFALLFGFAVGWFNEVRTLFLTGNGEEAWYETLGVDAAGNPLIGSLERDHYEYRTLDGESTTRDIAIHAAGLRSPTDESDNGLQSGWEGRVSAFSDGANPPVYWYFLVTDDTSHGRGHFVGYNAAGYSITGYIAKKGFSPSPPSMEDEFAIDGRAIRLNSELFRVWGDYLEAGYTPGK